MRVDYSTVFPAAIQAMAGLEAAVHQSSPRGAASGISEAAGLPAERMRLLRGHDTKDAEAIGVEAQRLHLAVVWREAPVYSSRCQTSPPWPGARP